MTSNPVVFLVDVDNTLLDNDRIEGDLNDDFPRFTDEPTITHFWEVSP